ncbi:MAG: hypothetical protein KBG40_05335 [Bacteroidales bacterium]|nr:hypothetical protein [Bacteroidales bacterium]
MKTKIINSVIISSLVIMSLSGGLSIAQDKTLTDKEKEARLQQAIEERRKVMEEETKVIEQHAGELEKQKIYIQEGERSTGRASQDSPPRSDRSFYVGREGVNQPFYANPQDFGFNVWRGSGDSERTSFEFAKSVKESSFSHQFSFEVEENVKNVVMNISGDCKAGEIKVKIIMPGGKTYSDIVIDELGNLNWRKSFTISDEENKDKIGEWIFKVEAVKATGFFRISLQSY